MVEVTDYREQGGYGADTKLSDRSTVDGRLCRPLLMIANEVQMREITLDGRIDHCDYQFL